MVVVVETSNPNTLPTSSENGSSASVLTHRIGLTESFLLLRERARERKIGSLKQNHRLLGSVKVTAMSSTHSLSLSLSVHHRSQLKAPIITLTMF